MISMAEKVRIIERTRVVIGMILISLFPILVSLAIISSLSAINGILTLKVMAFWFGTTLLGFIILPRLQIIRKEENFSFDRKLRRKIRRFGTPQKFVCSRCGKIFSNGQAMGGHKSACKRRK